MKKLRIGADGFSIDPGIAEDVVAILGRRGRGKTNTAVVFVEELQAAGARFCVADPVGVWWGLKSSKDGSSAGIPVVVMGGDRRDVPLEETAGRVIADFVADPSSPSVVLDFRGFRKAQMARFMADFLEQLYQRNREPLHLVLDEADQFAPQRFTGEVARLVGASEDVCKMGRARGLHPIVITQRPAALNKNVLTQAGLLVCHQLTGPQDQKAVDEWIRANADDHVRARRTFDSSATPKRGEERTGPRVLAEVDLEALKKSIASTIEKAKAEDPRELRKTITDLRAQLTRAQAAKPAAAPAPAKAPRVVEKSVLKDSHVKGLERLIARMEKAAIGFQAAAAVVDAQAKEIRAVLATRPQPGRGIAALIPDPRPATPTPAARARPAATTRPAPTNGGGGLEANEQRILDTVAMLYARGLPVTREAVARWQGLHPNGGRFNRGLARLRETGHLDGFRLTESGAAAARPLETGATALVAALPDEGHRRVMSEILAAGGPLPLQPHAGLAARHGSDPRTPARSKQRPARTHEPTHRKEPS